MKKWLLILFLLIGFMQSFAQPKKPNAVVISKYDDRFRVKLIRIWYDSLYFIGTPFNSDSLLNQFYLRKSQNEHVIAADYLKAVIIKPGKVIGKSTWTGLLVGGVIGAFLGYHGSKGINDNALTNVYHGAIGFGIGAIGGGGIGLVIGIFQRKKIYINGSTTQLNKLETYLQ